MTQRNAQQSQFATYGDYLDSLEMEAEIDRFQPVYLERIAQLTNKTNQFNLTTQRCTPAEMEAYAADPDTVPLYGRLRDRFGDSGLVSVVVGRRQGSSLHLDLWLMSCRVLKRDMEKAMLDSVVEHAEDLGVKSLVGYYRPTKKNGMVADFYRDLGFSLQSKHNETTVWELSLHAYEHRNTHIKVISNGHDRRIDTREASTYLS
jgi:FkbH-like protein